MAVDALAIDIMLPALPNIGAAFSVADPNDRSLVVIAFMLGFGLPQLLFGPVTDRFGRRAPVLIGLAAYVVTALLAPLAPSFAVMLALRFLQGIAAASVRVALFASVRDRFSGKAMSDIMSMVLAVFLLVPIFMPAVGQIVLFLGPWQLVFVVMGLTAAVIAIWAMIRLPESLSPENRRALDLKSVGEGIHDRAHQSHGAELRPLRHVPVQRDHRTRHHITADLCRHLRDRSLLSAGLRDDGGRVGDRLAAFAHE